MLTDVKLNVAALTPDLIKVKAMLKETDNMAVAMVCNMYIELCADIGEGIVPTSTSMIVKRMEAEKRDGMDRPYRHNINAANRPSTMQEIAFEKENKDKK